MYSRSEGAVRQRWSRGNVLKMKDKEVFWKPLEGLKRLLSVSGRGIITFRSSEAELERSGCMDGSKTKGTDNEVFWKPLEGRARVLSVSSLCIITSRSGEGEVERGGCMDGGKTMRTDREVFWKPLGRLERLPSVSGRHIKLPGSVRER